MPVSLSLPDELIELIAYSGYLWTFHLFRKTCKQLHTKFTLLSRGDKSMSLESARNDYSTARSVYGRYSRTLCSRMRSPLGWKSSRYDISFRTYFVPTFLGVSFSVLTDHVAIVFGVRRDPTVHSELRLWKAGDRDEGQFTGGVQWVPVVSHQEIQSLFTPAIWAVLLDAIRFHFSSVS